MIRGTKVGFGILLILWGISRPLYLGGILPWELGGTAWGFTIVVGLVLVGWGLRQGGRQVDARDR